MKDSVTKNVEKISNGIIVTVTSDDAAVVEKIQNKEHRDPKNEEITRTIENISNGVKMTITSDNSDLVEKIQNHEDRLQKTLQTMIHRLDHFRSEYRMAKSTGRMQSAQSKLASHREGTVSRFGDMQDSLDRIREKQMQFSDELAAMDQINANLSGESMDDEAGLNTSGNEILNRIKYAEKQSKKEE